MIKISLFIIRSTLPVHRWQEKIHVAHLIHHDTNSHPLVFSKVSNHLS